MSEQEPLYHKSPCLISLETETFFIVDYKKMT